MFIVCKKLGGSISVFYKSYLKVGNSLEKYVNEKQWIILKRKLKDA